ncbi:MAG: DNA-binding response regulator [Nevskia sp.]|nr:DNA-binding response regulator [Nevskia sp.]
METAQPHLLIVDDDTEICVLLSEFLARQGFRVSIAHNGKAMMQTLAETRVNLVILDLMLPGEDGLSLCKRLRARSALPIIMLTALAEPTERIIGLELGADDYLPKPFVPHELLARVRAVLRRASELEGQSSGDRQRSLEFAGWRLDVGRRELYSPRNALVSLPAGEFDLLLILLERPHRILSRDTLLDLARGRIPAPFDRSIDVQISRLRRKIEVDPKEPLFIKTVRGGGYVFSAPVTVIADEA